MQYTSLVPSFIDDFSSSRQRVIVLSTSSRGGSTSNAPCSVKYSAGSKSTSGTPSARSLSLFTLRFICLVIASYLCCHLTKEENFLYLPLIRPARIRFA